MNTLSSRKLKFCEISRRFSVAAVPRSSTELDRAICDVMRRHSGTAEKTDMDAPRMGAVSNAGT